MTMGSRVNYSGLAVAGIGFFLTRFTVTLAIYEEPIRFYFAGVVPLALGLGLAAFGVALAVADVEASLVRTTALWCVIGAGTMLVLVVLTLLGSTTGGIPDFATVRSRTYLSNFLIGGSVGGTLTGLYAARNQRQQGELKQQAHRLEVLNRILRHEVLNAVAVIKGYVTTTRDETLDARAVIEERSSAIEQTIEEVRYLTQRAGPGTAPIGSVNVTECLKESVKTVTNQHPEVSVSIGSIPEDVMVSADEHLEQVFTHLLENAIVHAKDDNPAVEISVTTNTVHVSIRDEGPGLPESQQTILETGDIEEFDDPGTGFGLNVVRLLVEDYGGTIQTDGEETGTTITVVLPRTGTEVTALRLSKSDLGGVRPAVPHLSVTLVAAVVAGVPYGIVAELLGGSVAGIGVFYGTADPVIGWLTHEFHSVVFGFMFAGLVSLAPERYRTNVSIYVAIGIGWALFLWIVAAGFIAPIWLRLLAIPAPIPNFSSTLLASHLAWGISLGLLTVGGYKYVTPWIVQLGEQLR